MTDEIRLTGLRITGRHGVLPVERAAGQVFVIDAALELDTAPAASSDELADTIDYGAVVALLTRIVGGEPVALIETLAARLADACLAETTADAVTITVHKPQAPLAADITDVAVTVRRQRTVRPRFRAIDGGARGVA